jgi:hypothetical protein
LPAAGEFFGEEINARVPEAIIGRGEVDQVAVVADGFAEFEASEMGFPRVDCLGGQGFAFPLLLVFGEDLDGVAAEGFGGDEGVFEAAGDGEVGTKHLLITDLMD